MNRIRKALRTNEPQATNVVMFSFFTLAVVIMRGDAPLWTYFFAGLFWPMVAFTSNLFDPIPGDEEEKA